MVCLCVCECKKTTIEISQIILDVSPDLSELAQAGNQEIIAENIRNVLEKNTVFKFLPDKKDVYSLFISILSDEQTSNLILLGYLEYKNKSYKKHYANIDLSSKNIEKQSFEKALEALLSKIYNDFYADEPNNINYLDIIKDYKNIVDGDKNELVNAASLAGEHKNKQAIPYLIEILHTTNDIALANACMISLGELQAKEAMEGIIEFSLKKPPIIKRQAIIAAKKIASKLALDWLFVMAYGYNDFSVNQEAYEAFLEVEKKLNEKK